MKNTLLLILSGALMASCTNEVINQGESDEIQIRAGLNVHTRADLPTGVVNGTAFPANTENLFAVYAYPSTFIAGGSPYIANLSVQSDAASALSFSTPQYYPISGNKLLFYAYSPVLTEGEGDDQVSGQTTTDALVAKYVITGQEDILYANALGADDGGIGKMTTGQLHPEFTFKHQLTQLRFTVKAGVTFTSSVAVSVNSIEVVDANTVKMNLRNGSMEWETIPVAMTAYSDATGIPVESDASAEFGSIMVKPQTGAEATYKLDIVAGGVTYTPVVTIVGGTQAGHAYTVNLTFDATEIAPTAKITDWVSNPTNGTGTIG